MQLLDRIRKWHRPGSLLFLAGIIHCAPVLPPDGPLKNVATTDVSHLESVVSQEMQNYGVPGLALAVIQQNEVAYSRGFGTLAIDSETPVDADTRFEAASIGKVLTAFALLQILNERGISPDDFIHEHLALNWLPDAGEAARTIRFRHLLAHTAGLSNAMSDDGRGHTLDFPPGDRFRYSGVGYQYTQAIIAAFDGNAFEASMQRRVLRPFGMTRSAFVYDTNWSNVANGHVRGIQRLPFLLIPALIIICLALVLLVILWQRTLRNRDTLPFYLRWPIFLHLPVLILIGTTVFAYNHSMRTEFRDTANIEANAASSLYSTANDLARFAQALLRSQLRHELFAPVVPVPEALVYGSVEDLSWGSGIAVQNPGTQAAAVWQWGSNLDYQGLFLLYPQQERGLIVLTNSSRGFKSVPAIVEAAIGGQHVYAQYLRFFLRIL